jgi:N-acyl homoserine lactone hydrolase
MNQVYPLLTGFLGWPAPPSLTPIMHPVYAWLIVTRGGRSILVDTGNPRSLAGKSRALPWFDAPLMMGGDDDLAARLARTGHSIDDIDLLVATHFDFDHCGNHDLFDNSGITCVAQRAMLDDAETGDRYDRHLWLRPGIRYQRLVGDAEIDHGVTLLETSGHAVGHQSLSVQIDGGSVLLAIDALADSSAYTDGPFPSFYVDDEIAWRGSREKLIRLSERTGALMIFGHDPAQARLLGAGDGPITLTEALRQSGAPVRRAE